MKNLIYLFIATASLINYAFGQNYPKAGDYIRDENLDKFVGTWEFKSDSETFRIILKKEKVNLKIYEADLIVGWHIYIKNGIVVESSMDNANTSYASSTLSGKSDSNNPNILSILFKDINRDRRNSATFELLSNKTDMARWTLVLAEKVTIGKPKMLNAEIFIPTPIEWTLTRIE